MADDKVALDSDISAQNVVLQDVVAKLQIVTTNSVKILADIDAIMAKLQAGGTVLTTERQAIQSQTATLQTVSASLQTMADQLAAGDVKANS